MGTIIQEKIAEYNYALLVLSNLILIGYSEILSQSECIKQV